MSGWETVTVREISEGAAAKTVFFFKRGQRNGRDADKRGKDGGRRLR